MLLVGQEIALSLDFCSTATLRLPKGSTPFGIPLSQMIKSKEIQKTN
jgi:hypothetical protein